MNHVCQPVDVVEGDREIRATCGVCGVPMVRFIVEDDERRPFWSGWVRSINRGSNA